MDRLNDSGNHTIILHPILPYNRSSLDEDNSMFSYYLWTITVPILFSLIIIFGVSGNLMVVIVILTNKKMRTLTNLLLLNLAVADLTFLCSCVPFQAYKFASLVFHFGDIVCKTVQYSLYVTAYVTVYTLVAVAGLRYATVVKSQECYRYRTQLNVIFICVGIWMIILILNIPTLFAHQITIVDVEEGHISYCGVVKSVVEPLQMSFFLFGYIIPLLLVSLFYLLIVIYLKKSNIHHQETRTSKIHTYRMIMVVIIVFGISWLPLHLHTLISLYGTVPEGRFYEILRVLWHCMAYGNSVVNPFIYAHASVDFRTAFKHLLLSSCCRKNVTDCAHHTTTAHIKLQETLIRDENKPC